MATTIRLYAGKRFQCEVEGKKGYGVLLTDGSAFIISGDGGRDGYRAEKVAMPTDESVLPLREIPAHAITFALDCVVLSHGLHPTMAEF